MNLVGLRRRGVSEKSIQILRQAHKLLFREHKPLHEVRAHFAETLEGIIPFELTNLLHFVEQSRSGKSGRAREAVRQPAASRDSENSRKKVA